MVLVIKKYFPQALPILSHNIDCSLRNDTLVISGGPQTIQRQQHETERDHHRRACACSAERAHRFNMNACRQEVGSKLKSAQFHIETKNMKTNQHRPSSSSTSRVARQNPIEGSGSTFKSSVGTPRKYHTVATAVPLGRHTVGSPSRCILLNGCWTPMFVDVPTRGSSPHKQEQNCLPPIDRMHILGNTRSQHRTPHHIGRKMPIVSHATSGNKQGPPHGDYQREQRLKAVKGMGPSVLLTPKQRQECHARKGDTRVATGKGETSVGRATVVIIVSIKSATQGPIDGSQVATILLDGPRREGGHAHGDHVGAQCGVDAVEDGGM